VTAPATAVPEPSWAAAVALLLGADEVALACHVNPDGDALGSMLALAQTLESLGKRAVCSWDGATPLALPTAYAGLVGVDLLVETAEFPTAPDVLVALDTGSLDRLGCLADVVAHAGAVLVIDHHASHEIFGTVGLIDPHAAATAVLVEELVRRLGAKLTADVAACLYTGLTTDTGSFKYASTTPAVHELAARLLATGIRHDEIARAIWDTNCFAYVSMLGGVLSRARLELHAAGGLGLVWTYSTAADLAAYGVGMEELEGVIDVIRTTAEAEVAAVCKQEADGSLKVSMRSKGRIDVGAVCVALGGGGHRFAAGLTTAADATTTMGKIRELLAAAPHLPA
jgi:phosphoesterase RecJ-like protein